MRAELEDSHENGCHGYNESLTSLKDKTTMKTDALRWSKIIFILIHIYDIIYIYIYYFYLSTYIHLINQSINRGRWWPPPPWPTSHSSPISTIHLANLRRPITDLGLKVSDNIRSWYHKSLTFTLQTRGRWRCILYFRLRASERMAMRWNWNEGGSTKYLISD